MLSVRIVARCALVSPVTCASSVTTATTGASSSFAIEEALDPRVGVPMFFMSSGGVETERFLACPSALLDFKLREPDTSDVANRPASINMLVTKMEDVG